MDTPKRPEALMGRPLPDRSLLDHEGRPYRLRQHDGNRPFVLFFYVRNGTPG